MKKIFCLSILLLLISYTGFSQVNIEESNIQKHIKMDVILSHDSILYGDTLNVTIIFENVSKFPIVFFSDAVIYMERFIEGIFSSELHLLSEFNTNFKKKIIIQPQKIIIKKYKIAVVSPFFYKGNLNIRFVYIAKPSKTIIDKIEYYRRLEIR